MDDEEEAKEAKYWMAEMKKDAKTLDAWFGFSGSNVEFSDFVSSGLTDDTEKTYKKVVIKDVSLFDEYSMMSHDKWFHVLYRVKLKYPDKILKFFGDLNQCPAIAKVLYDIRKCQVLKTILGKKGYIINMRYRRGADQRCDDRIMEVIESLKTTGKLPSNLFKHHDIKHLYRNKYTRWITYKRQTTIDNNSNIRDADDLKFGDIVICAQTTKLNKIQFYNNERLTVIKQYLDKNVIKLDLRRPNGDEFTNITNRKLKLHRRDTLNRKIIINTYLFTLDKSETVYKYQGETVDDKYIIQEGRRMSREMMITAFGRARKFNQIYLEDWQELLNHTFKSSYEPNRKLVEAPQKEMKVYRMYQMTMNIGLRKFYYVGYTDQKLRARRQQHIQNVDEIWNDNTKIIKIGEYLATSEKQAKVMEEVLIKEWKTKPEFKKCKQMNITHNKKSTYKCKYETVKEKIRLTLDDYLDKLIPYTDKDYENRYVSKLREEFGGHDLKVSYTPDGKKQHKKRDGSGDLIPYKFDAFGEFRQERIDIFKQHYPLLYETIIKNEPKKQ